MKPTAAPAYFPPTKRQQDALRYIAGYQAQHGWGAPYHYAPTLQDIADGIGAAAKSQVFYILDALEERGLVRRLPFRRIEVLTDISIPRSPTGEPLYFVRVP